METPREKKQNGVLRVFGRGYRTENAAEKQCTLRNREHGFEEGRHRGKREKKKRETSLEKGMRIPRPIYHKLKGLWRESSRILPEGAREMRTAVPRALLDKNIRRRRKKRNIGRKRESRSAGEEEEPGKTEEGTRGLNNGIKTQPAVLSSRARKT